MYDRLVAMLSDLGIDSSGVTPQSTFRDLLMDSLSMAELAVNALEETGVYVDTLTLDVTLAQAAEAFEAAAAPQTA
ncbi:phosphopantetheine-binding protein [Streptomyces sp. NPDC091204]|uniref:phosphopantetheine-binding protein n=1 Tax=Streptomyces sp. NPDC091204 TaxID=3155299 RepID=UPI003446E199